MVEVPKARRKPARWHNNSYNVSLHVAKSVGPICSHCGQPTSRSAQPGIITGYRTPDLVGNASLDVYLGAASQRCWSYQARLHTRPPGSYQARHPLLGLSCLVATPPLRRGVRGVTEVARVVALIFKQVIRPRSV